MTKELLTGIVSIAVCLLSSSCASHRTVFSGREICDGDGPPSRVLGCPSELRILNDKVSQWIYYFEQVNEPGHIMNYPAGTLCVATFGVSSDGKVCGGDFSPSVGWGDKYRLLQNDNAADMKWIVAYKKHPY